MVPGSPWTSGAGDSSWAGFSQPPPGSDGLQTYGPPTPPGINSRVGCCLGGLPRTRAPHGHFSVSFRVRGRQAS